MSDELGGAKPITGTMIRRNDSPSAIGKPSLDFNDHSTFHATVGRAVIGGALGGVLASVASFAFGAHGDIAAATLALATTSGAIGMIALRGRRWMRLLTGAMFGAGGSAAYLLAHRAWPVFAAALLGASIAPILAQGESKKKMAFTALVGAALGFAGLYVANWMQNIGLFSGMLPEPFATAGAGAAVGLFYGLASAPKHLAHAIDPVESAYLEALTIKDGEIHEILARALSIHRSVRTDLTHRKDDASVGKLGHRVGELAMRILQIASQCRQIERELDAAPAYELDERIAGLRRKAEAATDASARATYLGAVESLDGQRRALETIGRGRERVVARLHANVALLEKVRFSLLHLRSADAERIGGEASPLLEAIEELAREIDATSSAVGEVFGSNKLAIRESEVGNPKF